MVDSATELGRIIGGIANTQSSIQENLAPDDVNAQLNTVNSETVIIEGKLTVIKKYFDSNAFIIDHPIQGELDSSVYELDSGYTTTRSSTPLPWVFPVVFGAYQTVGTEIIYEKEF